MEPTIIICIITSTVSIVLSLINFFSQKKLHKYTGEQQKDINKMNATLTNMIFVTNKQYEKEFEIYLEIWESLCDYYLYMDDVSNCTSHKPYSGEGSTLYDEDTLKVLEVKVKKYMTLVSKYEPFYNSEISSVLNKIRDSMLDYNFTLKMGLAENKFCKEHSYLDSTNKKDNFKELVEDKPKNIRIMKERARAEIQKYLTNLKIKNI